MSEICQVGSDTAPIALVSRGDHNWVKCTTCGFAWIERIFGLGDESDDEVEAVAHSYMEKYLAKLGKKMRRMLTKHGVDRIRLRQSFGRGIKLFARRP